MNAGRSEFADGWRVLLGSTVGIGIGVSSLYFYSLGIFIKPLAAEFGWTRGAASLGALAGTIAAAVMSPIMGRLADRFGSLTIALASLLMLAASFAAHGWFISGLANFLIITFFASLLTAGSSPMVYTRLTIASFVKHRGLALGIVLAGTGAGAILMPKFLSPFVAIHGWRSGYLILSGVILLGMPLVALLLRGAKDPAGAKASPLPLSQILGATGFAHLAAMFFFTAIAVLGTVVQFVPMLSDSGLSPTRAGGIAALIGVAAIGGRLLIGALLDRFPPASVTAGLFFSAAAGQLVLVLGGIGLAVPGALITGLAVGAEVDLLAFHTVRYYPETAFGQANGILYAIFLTGGAIGPALSGALYDYSGNYRLSLLVATALLTAAGAIALRLPKVARELKL